MASNTLSILKPSVNNLTTRIFVRAADLDFAEEDMWGKKGTPDFLHRDPADLTPLLEEDGLPKGALWESCAIMQYLCNKHGLEASTRATPGAGDGGQRDVLSDRHALPARRARDLSGLSFPQYAGEVGCSDADDAMKAKAQQEAADAIAVPLEVYRSFFLDGQPFIGGDQPSIADIRLAATLEFLRAIDYPFPQWTEDYMARDGGGARRRVFGAGAGRPRLRRLRQVAGRLTGFTAARRWRRAALP